MADKFSETRNFFWRDLEFIRDYVKNGDKILDFGCGNGRLLELFHAKVEPSQYIGLEISQKMVDVARSKYSGNNLKFEKISGSDNLPFSDNYFNSIYSIAVFHHMPSHDYRLQTAKELYRVTKPGGHIIITAWNLWQRKYIKNIFINWAYKIIGKSNLDWNDCYITFKNNKGEIFSRYHHAFHKSELKKLFHEAGFKIEKIAVIAGKNIILMGKKIRA